MKDRCFQAEELGSLREDDPRWKHLEECPRCRSLMKEYRAFMAGSGDVDLGDAEERLGRVLTVDPGLGVARHADAGYDLAKTVATNHGIKIPMLPME